MLPRALYSFGLVECGHHILFAVSHTLHTPPTHIPLQDPPTCCPPFEQRSRHPPLSSPDAPANGTPRSKHDHRRSPQLQVPKRGPISQTIKSPKPPRFPRHLGAPLNTLSCQDKVDKIARQVARRSPTLRNALMVAEILARTTVSTTSQLINRESVEPSAVFRSVLVLVPDPAETADDGTARARLSYFRVVLVISHRNIIMAHFD